MPRLQTIEPASATGAVKEIFDGPLAGKHFNIFKAMANSQAALQMYLNMNMALANSELSDAEKETIQLVVGQANGCNYCVAAHTALGKQAGLSESQTLEARRGEVSGDPKLRALSRFAAAINEKKGWVSDEDIETFRDAGYGDGAVAEVVAVYALAIYTNIFNHVNETPVDFPAAPALD